MTMVFDADSHVMEVEDWLPGTQIPTSASYCARWALRRPARAQPS